MKKNISNLNVIRKGIQRTQLILILLVTVFMSTGGLFINLKTNEKEFNENLLNTSELITRLYSFTSGYSPEQLKAYMDDIVENLSGVDIVSIVDTNGTRIYHTHHELINTKYDGTIPDFSRHESGYYTEDDKGPSGPQRRTYSAVYDNSGEYSGFIMTIRLKSSMAQVTLKTVALFLSVTLVAIILELAASGVLFKKIKKEFLSFTEDFEGTKILVDSMRANNHDFTNKLHVILGLIQIGEYEKAQNYIQNISIIQRETVTFVMRNIENPSLAALLIGKIARASECNVKFSLKENSTYKEKDIDIPSEALVTITGNLIDNALDAMNRSHKECKELSIGIYSKPGDLLLIVQDSGPGIPKDIREAIFEKGFSTKGKGRGLGLYHTKQLILSLGGEIFVESQVGKGCCFTVKLKRD